MRLSEHRPRHMAFVTPVYPTADEPVPGCFVEEFVRAVARRGTRCTVVHPIALHRKMRSVLFSHGRNVVTEAPHDIRVLRPLYVSLGDKRFGSIRARPATDYCFRAAVGRVFRRMGDPPDVFYGHFLCPAGVTAGLMGRMTGRASVAAIGEGSFHHYADCSRERLTREAHNVTGFIAVSPKVKEGLISEYKVSASKIAVFPNGVDLSCFRPRDRRVMREKYGLPLDKFLVAFVGHFNDHKGVLRVSEAVKGLEGVGAVYLGSGGLEPDPSSAFFCGVLSHARVPEVLSAADLFVLPTLFEGSCNAIVEAMACGLPIVSSDGEFNDDVLDPSMSIRVNPRDVVAIREAIRRFQKDEALRRRAATCARERAKRFDLATRVQKILTWIGELTAGFSQPVVARDGGP